MNQLAPFQVLAAAGPVPGIREKDRAPGDVRPGCHHRCTFVISLFCPLLRGRVKRCDGCWIEDDVHTCPDGADG